MKKNMKKLASLLFMVMLVLGLTACGSTEEPAETVVESAYAESLADFFVTYLQAMSAEEVQYYLDMDEEDLQEVLDSSGIPVEAVAFQTIFGSYVSDADTFGEYISTDDYELKGDDKEATHITNLTFSGHPATITLVFDEDGVVTSATIDPVLSIGEILQKAGLNTVIGMGTVFVVLIFISFIISLLPKLTDLITGFGKKKETPAQEAPKTAAPVAAAPATEELADDLELAAVISAAIAAYTGTSSDDFVVRSIRRSTGNKWKKA